MAAAVARVALAGAAGRTGREVGRAIASADDMELVAALGHTHVGDHLGALWGDPDIDLVVVGSVGEAATAYPTVLVDFTEPESAFPRLVDAVDRGWSIVVGTTGFSRDQRTELARRTADRGVAAALIANFSIGAWLSERLAEEAAQFFPDAEVVEAHHATKRDRPSGTALRMAALLAKATRRDPENIPVHSIRLPGLVAHQTVLFGSAGQVLTIRHDVHDRSAYAAGVLAAIRRLPALGGRVVEDLGELLAHGPDH
jgi:4-hydroxy-tetrahydrodipicolinate reductase